MISFLNENIFLVVAGLFVVLIILIVLSTCVSSPPK